MEIPAIIWRNPKVVQRRRLWNQTRRNDNSRIYIVVRSGYGEESEWEGLPNLEMIEGGARLRADKSAHRGLCSRG